MTQETRAEQDCRRPRRARRRSEGVVAQYIHELSERHREALKDVVALVTEPARAPAGAATG